MSRESKMRLKKLEEVNYFDKISSATTNGLDHNVDVRNNEIFLC